MSAFVLGDAHITALVDLALRGPHLTTAHRWANDNPSMTLADGTLTGRMLLRENERSVALRYREVPGDVEHYVYPEYPARERWRPSALEGLKLLICYDYQSSESDNWEATEAYQWCDRLRHALTVSLPGYEDAPWEWPGA